MLQWNLESQDHSHVIFLTHYNIVPGMVHMEYHDHCRALHNSIAIPMERCSVASQLILIAWADSRAHSLTIAILHYMISIFHTCINRSAGANIYGMRYAHTDIYNIIYNLLRIERPCCTIICRASCSAMIARICMNKVVYDISLGNFTLNVH